MFRCLKNSSSSRKVMTRKLHCKDISIILMQVHFAYLNPDHLVFIEAQLKAFRRAPSRQRERAPRYGLTVTHGHARPVVCVKGGTMHEGTGACPPCKLPPWKRQRQKGNEGPLRFHTTWLTRLLGRGKGGTRRDRVARATRKSEVGPRVSWL